MKYVTPKQYAYLSPWTFGHVQKLIKNGKIETTIYLGERVIDTEKYPIPENKGAGGRKIGVKNKKEPLTDEQKKERNKLAVAKFRDKNKKES